MNRRITGTIFLAVAAFLYATRYLAAAIYGSGVTSWNREMFRSMLSYVGNNLLILSIVFALAGLAYLAWGELKEK
jgi:hypothetical protein